MKRILFTCFILCLCAKSFAFTSFKSPTRTFVSAGVGDMFARIDGDNYLGTGAGWPDDHYSKSGVSDQPYGFLGAGYIWERDNMWLPNYSLGFRLMYVSASTVSGSIDQYSLPAFNNYTYSYDASLFNLLAIYKIDLVRWHKFMPYLTVGAGIASYHTSDYSESANSNVTPRVSPGFSDNSGENLAYQLGVGVDWAVQENIWVNAEFNYVNFGTIYTGKGANYATLTGTNYDNEQLKNKLVSTSVFLGLTYFTA